MTDTAQEEKTVEVPVSTVLMADLGSRLIGALWELPGFEHTKGNSLVEDVLDLADRLRARQREEEDIDTRIIGHSLNQIRYIIQQDWMWTTELQRHYELAMASLRATPQREEGNPSPMSAEAVGGRVNEYSSVLYDIRRELIFQGCHQREVNVLTYILSGEGALGAAGLTKDDLPDATPQQEKEDQCWICNDCGREMWAGAISDAGRCPRCGGEVALWERAAPQRTPVEFVGMTTWNPDGQGGYLEAVTADGRLYEWRGNKGWHELTNGPLYADESPTNTEEEPDDG